MGVRLQLPCCALASRLAVCMGCGHRAAEALDPSRSPTPGEALSPWGYLRGLSRADLPGLQVDPLLTGELASPSLITHTLCL